MADTRMSDADHIHRVVWVKWPQAIPRTSADLEERYLWAKLSPL